MRSRPRSRSNLPDVGSSFVGRDADLAALGARFDAGARLVTLTGPGGVGKTRTALRFAASQVERYSAHGAGGVWFADVTLARTQAGLVSTLAAAIDVPLGVAAEPIAASLELGRALGRRGETLVVLDNFEQVVDEGASLVARWLSEAPLVRFLVTSRVALGVACEERWPLDPLSEVEATALFVARARQVLPSFTAPDGDPVVADIVRALDRMPLAIELAASRVSILAPTALRDRLRTPLELLVRPGDDSRHASVRRTVEDSVRLLGPTAQATLVGASVFRGGFTLAAAERVIGGATILEDLETLVRHSLLRATPQPSLGGELRFSLFETIREVASELARADAPSEARRAERHALHYAEVARAAGRLAALGTAGPGPATLAAELDNITAAHAHACASGSAMVAFDLALGVDPLLSTRGLAQARVDLLDLTLSLAGVGDEVAGPVAESLVLRGMAKRELGFAAEARQDLEDGLGRALVAGRPTVAALASIRQGEILEVAGQTSGAHAAFARALAILGTVPPGPERTRCEAEAYLRSGHTHRREGALESADAAIERATERFRQLANEEGLSASLYEAGVVAMFQGRRDAALARMDEGIEIAARTGARMVWGALVTARGGLLQELGRGGEALPSHAEAARAFRELGARYREMSALYYLATAYVDAANPAEALRILSVAEERGHGVDAPRYQALIEGARAVAHVALGDPEAAARALVRAEAAYARAGVEPALGATLAIHALTVRGEHAAERAAALAAAHPSDDSRFALRTLISGPRRLDRTGLRLEDGGRSLHVPNANVPVDLSRRRALRAIVGLLAARRVGAPGEVVTPHEILEAGWPGERVSADAAMNRVYVALTTLRNLGLRDAIVTGAGGYMLSPAISVVVVDDAAPLA